MNRPINSNNSQMKACVICNVCGSSYASDCSCKQIFTITKIDSSKIFRESAELFRKEMEKKKETENKESKH